MNSRTVAVKPFWDVLAQAWDAISFAKDAPETALWILSGVRYLYVRLRRRKPKQHHVTAHRVRAHITTGVPTVMARASISPPDRL